MTKSHNDAEKDNLHQDVDVPPFQVVKLFVGSYPTLDIALHDMEGKVSFFDRGDLTRKRSPELRRFQEKQLRVALSTLKIVSQRASKNHTIYDHLPFRSLIHVRNAMQANAFTAGDQRNTDKYFGENWNITLGVNKPYPSL